MASNVDLLERYRQNREEIDVLADERTLFVLGLIQQLDNPSLKELTDHLNWDLKEAVAVCIKLENAGLIQIKEADNPLSQIELLQRGANLLGLFLYQDFTPDRIPTPTKENDEIDMTGLAYNQGRSISLPSGTPLTMMTELELTDVWNRLRFYTYKHFYWFHGKTSSHLDLDDLIQDAIVEVLTGRRHIPNNVSATAFLCQNIRGKVIHLWKEQERGRILERKVKEGKTRTVKKHPSKFSEPRLLDSLLNTFFTGHPHSPPTNVPIDKQNIISQVIRSLLGRVNSNESLTRIVHLLIENPDIKIGELPGILNISLSKARSAHKRLTKEVRKLRKEEGTISFNKKLEEQSVVETELALAFEDVDPGIVATTPFANIYDELQEMGLDPDQDLPERISHLIASGM